MKAITEWECDAVLFDLDGVLVNSTACVERHWRRWAVQHNLDADEVMRFAHGRPTVETIRLVAPHLPADVEAAQLDAGEAVDTAGVVAVDGAARLVKSIPLSAWAISTSGTRKTALVRLRYTGVPIPAVLVTADDVELGKPHPEPYLLAAARLGVRRERCVVVEDAPAGIMAAHAAGMRVVALLSTHPKEDLGEADARAMVLADLHILLHGDRLTVGVTGI